MARDDIFDGETMPSGDEATAPAASASGTGGPVPGQTWARYVVLDALGAGGMGAVWSAYDPELERTVALKVLHDELLGRASQERLRREARAMARVSHPNVVPVFDVGEHAGRSFYTMELVRGQSFKDWAKTQRSWREVAAVFVEAARGLAAIHAAGLVHRDVKPGNLLYGDDGRARIADLGIAMSAPELIDAPEAVPLVATTTLRHAGTPAYMAPEQLRGDAGDALSDQFSFGVALWELLHGKPPFRGESIDARLASIEEGPSSVRDVPAWLDAAARKAMALAPADRFADVATLARVLEGPRARRWPIVAGAIVIAAGAAAAATALFVRKPDNVPAPRDTCATAGAALDEAWPAGAAAARAKALGPVQPGAPDPAALTADLDRAVVAWRTAAKTACTNDARGAWSPQVGARATHCLARRRGELGRAIAAPDAVGLAARLRELGPSSRCLDPDALALAIEPPADPVRGALIDSSEGLLHVVSALADGGHPDLAEQLLDRIGSLPAHLDYTPIQSLGASARAQVAMARGDYRRAADVLEQDYYASRAAGDDDDALTAIAQLLGLAAGKLGDQALATRWIGIARADAQRRKDTDAAGIVFVSIAAVEVSWGDAAAAVDDARAGVELLRKTDGEANPQYAHAVGLLAIALDSAGRHREALPFYDQQLAHLQRWYGHDNPALIDTVQNEALALSDLGETPRALERARWAQQIVDGWHDATPAKIGEVYLTLGVVLENDQQHAAAVTVYERAAAALEQAFGPDHRDVALAHTNLALARVQGAVAAHDDAARDAAIRELGDAAARTERIAGPEDPDTLSAQLHYASALRRPATCARARTIAQRVLDILDRDGAARANGGKLVTYALETIGECELDAGANADAIATLTRAIAVGGDDQNQRERARIRGLLAVAYLHAGDRDRAIELERGRRDDLRSSGAAPAELAGVEAWLASPKGDPP
ncbi:MAG TPA: protein kinase [Kofleriaceae bacterium]|nr:protein kinase [Kofleriaceae bacterium]